jgi:hypothetical protein
MWLNSSDRPSESRSLGPWLAVAAMWGLFELPMAFAPDRIDPGALRPTGEMLALFTAVWLSYRVRHGSVIRWLAAALAIVLVVVRIDRAVFFVLRRAEPLLYDQLFMLRHLFVMLSDLFGIRTLLGIFGFALAAALSVLVVRVLLRRAAPLLSPSQVRRTSAVCAALWVIFIAATAFGPRPPGRPAVRWMIPDLAQNIEESRRIYRAVRHQINQSPYRSFDRVRLVRKPDVLVFFVESYGKLMAEEPRMRPVWVAELGGMEERLTRAGWHVASAYSTAPVSGGSSWLAVGSILMGTTIRYEAVFRQLIAAAGRMPTLVRFFSSQGYETVHLAPSDRARPGVEAENDYRFDRYLAYEDLEYRGPAFGFGIVPDQYALGYTEEHVLTNVTRPLFFEFHMVSSHAEWDSVPPYVTDWHTLNRAEGARPEEVGQSEIGVRLARYSHEEPRFSYMGALTATLRENYQESIYYDFRVIENFVLRTTRDALVVVMGDHQPPIVAPETAGFEVPIHLFARDPKLLDEFTARGFTPGLVLPGDRPAAVEHGGLFSLLVRGLARSSGDGAPLPTYYRNGVRLGG